MKNWINNNKKIFVGIAIGLLVGVGGVSAATIFASDEVSYDNSTSNLESTNVQDAIDELYELYNATPAVSSPADLKNLAVTTGDGLYADSTESGRYVYKGANPDNYICLGDLSNGTCPSDSLYRIISTESDGSIKVIKNTSIGNIMWDPSYSSALTYNGTTLSASNNVSGTRRQGTSTASYFCRDYNTTANSSYYGCKSWGSATTTLNSSGSTTSSMPHQVGGTALPLPTYNSWLNTYLNGGTYHKTTSTTTVTAWYDGSNGLNSTVKSNVLSTKAFNIGPVANDRNATDLSTSRTQEATYKWKGKVGLMNVTDYVAASTNSACTTLNKYTSDTNCYNDSGNHNWLFLGSNEWTISPYSTSYAHAVWVVNSSGNTSSYSTYYTLAVRPVLYLSSSINLSGKGTNDSDVYTIS